MTWDVFIAHAGEDKSIARSLAEQLRAAGLLVWFDEQELKLGDSLREKIDEGLAQSRFGVVILSTSFFAKDWPKRELDGLTARELDGVKLILPVWEGVDHRDIAKYSPTLADRLGVSTSKGLDLVVEQILKAASPRVATPTPSISKPASDTGSEMVDVGGEALRLMQELKSNRLTAGDLTAKLGIPHAKVEYLLSELEGAGYVSRRKAIGSSSEYHLSEGGRKFLVSKGLL